MRDLMGKRILFQRVRSEIQMTDILEGYVWDISPNELYVRLQENWYLIDEIKVLDILDNRYLA